MARDRNTIYLIFILFTIVSLFILLSSSHEQTNTINKTIILEEDNTLRYAYYNYTTKEVTYKKSYHIIKNGKTENR